MLHNCRSPFEGAEKREGENDKGTCEVICLPVQAASRSWATALHFAKTMKGRHIQQSFPLSKVLPLSAVTPLCFSLLGLIIPFASLYHVLASSFFTTSPYLSWYLPLCRFFPPTSLFFFFYHLALPPLCHFPTLAHLSLLPSCAKCGFYRSQQSLSVRGPFSVHIGIKRQDKHGTAWSWS